ncbi:MAG: hypothetical protein JNK48_09490 [Bryobacterales bacterium]|nr:hypothetical protein [Bryobacterales bacterium]
MSRQGLLLLNHTLVEPGYHGPLHAVFVNFGKQKVVLSPVTKIAKVVFFELDKSAENLVRLNTSDYDDSILRISANAPDSFMQLNSLVPSIKVEAEEQIRILKEAASKQAADAKANITAELAKQGADIEKRIRDLQPEMQTDLKKYILRWGGGAAIGLVVGVGIVWLIFSTYLPRIAASYADVDGIARRAVQERAAALDAASAEVRANRADLDALRQELQALKQQNANLEKRAGSSPNQRTSQ